MHAFRLAIAPVLDVGERPMGDEDLARVAQAVATPFEVGPAGTHRAVPLAIEGDDLVFSALKRAEDGDGWIVRAWNAAGSDRLARVSGPAIAAERCRLDETPLSPEEAVGEAVGPCSIATWRFRRRAS